MDGLQKWHKNRDQWRFNTGNRVRVTTTGEVGIIKCCGSVTQSEVLLRRQYMIEITATGKWISVQEHEVESAPHES
jgi:hypothetical protein